MSFHKQKTISEEIQFRGVGLHSGKFANLIIKPAAPNTGVVFIRKDLIKNNIIYPQVSNVSNATLCTTISNEFNVKISTIEHLMGAFYGLGIDNAIVEIDNEEVPILDGSAKVFVDEILKVGLKVSDIPIKVIRINKLIEYIEGPKFISIMPSKINLEIDFEIKYQNQLIGDQKNTLKVYEDDLDDIFNSRTFCLYEDVEKLKSMGFAKGGSLKNALVVKDDKVLNEDGLRNKKEFVNHKILDCMGDLFLSGYKMIGKIKCSQGGHKLTNDLLKKVFQDKENYSIVEINEKNIPHSLIYRQKLRSIA
ncbi:UDP-3-O-[3-hydroxymyristoyl] N-acetylglucosamine deacetylase [Pelagibacterales bacterium SAG-MED07]|nr:UDP-3-O-[3-hydroxymyristoyl] N-acetylglucosamine deacetylase [Pelagibacterales bacterium SAG-MED07]